MLNKDTRVSWDWLSREYKIKRIYEVIAWKKVIIVQDKWNDMWHRKETRKEEYIPVMIWDVLDWIEINNIEEKQHEKIRQRKWEWTQYTYTPVNSMILALYKEKRKSIENQTDNCINYIDSLLATNQPTTS